MNRPPALPQPNRNFWRAIFRVSLISVLLWTGIALGLAQCRAALAEPYALIHGGPIESGQQSNNDEIEFGSEVGGFVGAEGGYLFDLDRLGISVGLEASHRWKDLHGQNGSKCDQRSCSADGETLHLTALMINARTEYRVAWIMSLYGMVGAGGAYADGLGNSDIVPIAQGEAGLLLSFTDSLSAGAGYRHARAFDVSLDGNSGSLDFYGPVGWLRWRFK